jgi:excisionase family DNA binding protein
MRPAPFQRTYRTGEVADLLGVDRSTLLKWIRAGELDDVGRDGANNYRVWTLDDVRRALRVWREREDARVEQCRTARQAGRVAARTPCFTPAGGC